MDIQPDRIFDDIEVPERLNMSFRGCDVEFEGVAPITNDKPAPANAADQRVVPSPPEQSVFLGISPKRVVAAACSDAVLAGPAVDLRRYGTTPRGGIDCASGRKVLPG